MMQGGMMQGTARQGSALQRSRVFSGWDQRPRAPLQSSAYVGLSSSRAAATCSTSCASSSSDPSAFLSSSRAAQYNTSTALVSSSDILSYLRDHVDYQRMPSGTNEALAATIASSAALGVSAVLVVATAGTATPLLLLSLRALGHAHDGWVRGDFSWSKWSTDAAVSTGLTLITSGAAYGAGGAVGIALRGNALSETAVQAIGAVVGGITGAATRTGAYLLLRKVDGVPVEAVHIVLQAGEGLVAGAFIGASAAVTWSASSAAEAAAVGAAFRDPTHVGRFQQTVIEAWHHEDIGSHIGLVAGWQNTTNTGGAGLIHIMYRHPDVFEALGYSANDVTNALLSGQGSPAFQRMADDLLRVLREPPLGICHADRGATSFVWRVRRTVLGRLREYQIRATISNRPWEFGSQSIIQANRVNLPFNRILPLHVAKMLR